MIERREHKILVPPERLPALRAAILPTCVRDRHARADGLYQVRSLYLDTPDLRLFQANDREDPDRCKVRVRAYPDAPGAPAFLEVKRRTLDIIRKTRAPVPIEGWVDQVSPRAPIRGPAHERFVSLVHTWGLVPRLMVEYTREAWVSVVDHYARVSIDTTILAAPCEDWTLEADRSRMRACDHPVITATPASVAVLELKFAGAAPPWMVALVRRLDLVRHAYSKYGHGTLAALPPARARAVGA